MRVGIAGLLLAAAIVVSADRAAGVDAAERAGTNSSVAVAPSSPPPRPSSDPGSTCGSPRDCFARIAAAQRTVVLMRGDFRQTKRIALLNEPLISTGHLEFRAPDAVRWEVVSPEPLVVEIDAKGLRAGEPGALAEIGPAGEMAPLRDLGALFAAGGGRTAEQFSVEAGAGGDGSFVLVPRDPRLARIVAAVELELDPSTGIARRVVLREPSGDRTEIDLEVREVVRGEAAAPAGTR